MSASPVQSESGPREVIAGLMAAAAIFAAAVGLAHTPVRIIPFAVLLALASARMTTRWSRLAGFAVGATIVCWVVGMAIAVITKNPLY